MRENRKEFDQAQINAHDAMEFDQAQQNCTMSRTWRSADKCAQWNLTEHSRTRDHSRKHSHTRTRASKNCSKDFFVLKIFEKRKKLINSCHKAAVRDLLIKTRRQKVRFATHFKKPVASWPDHDRLEKKLRSVSWCDAFWALHLSPFLPSQAVSSFLRAKIGAPFFVLSLLTYEHAATVYLQDN